MHVLARTVAGTCKDGCSALQEGLQCTASETGKTGTEIASPILDRRKGRGKVLLHSYTNSWKSVYALGISGVGEGVGCCPGVGLILHFPSGYRISLINLDGRFLRKQTSLYINIMSKEYNVDVDDTLFKGSFTKENSYPYYPLSIFISLLLFLYHFTLLSAYILCDIK